MALSTSRLPPSLIATGTAVVAVGVVIIIVGLKNWFGRRRICQGTNAGEIRKPVQAILTNPGAITYKSLSPKVPKALGRRFKFQIRLAYTKFARVFLWPWLKVRNGMDALDGVYIPEKPTLYPTLPSSALDKDYTRANQEILQKLVEQEVLKQDVKKQFRLPTVADYVRAFRSGKVTPTDVAEAVLAAIAHSNQTNPPLRAIIDTCRPVVLAMASASTQRWKEGKPLSIIDGVPAAVKGELRIEPYELLSGAVFVSHLAHGLPESVMVQKLRDSGAIIIGVANLQEYGTGTLGSNPNSRHMTGRNPYDPRHYAGGSSTGSAISVAAGLCPIAIGSDGGGSIRIPAAACGVVGLKPTFSLVDGTGILPITYSVSASGPLCSSILDTAIVMDILAKETYRDKKVMSLEGLGESRVDGLRVGIYWEYFDDAEDDVVECCKAAVRQLESLGAEIVEIKIPELDMIRLAHFITIVSEFYSALAKEVDDHYSELNPETLFVLAFANHISSLEYINAQKQRTRAIEALQYIFKEQKIDIIVTPGIGCSAPFIDPAAISHGCSDSYSSFALMRFSYLANLTGIPGLVLPVGYTASGLPISLQLMGAWCQEKTLLKVGWALEQSGAFPTRKPQVFYDLLEMATSK